MGRWVSLLSDDDDDAHDGWAYLSHYNLPDSTQNSNHIITYDVYIYIYICVCVCVCVWSSIYGATDFLYTLPHYEMAA